MFTNRTTGSISITRIEINFYKNQKRGSRPSLYWDQSSQWAFLSLASDLPVFGVVTNLLHKHNKTLPRAFIIFMSVAEVFSSAKLWQFNDSCKHLMFCWQFLHVSHLMLMNTACGELFHTAVRTRGIDFFSGTSHFKLHGRKNVKKTSNRQQCTISDEWERQRG